MFLITRLLCLVIACSSVPAFGSTDDDLRATLERRLKGDRTGACIAAALIENGTTATAHVCASDASARPFDAHTAFEIGSISKTMTTTLLAEFIERGEIALDDPLEKLLPPGTTVPSFNGSQITVGHVVTHTSGLPSYPWRGGGADPYAKLSERDLLDTLSAFVLKRAPGSQQEYSNFAFMVLSYALAKRSGKDFETLLRERLLLPLGMNDTYVSSRPPHVRVAPGHQSNGRGNGPWNFHSDMAGVGGVRATLPDMVRYLEGQLGTRESPIAPAITRTHEQAAIAGNRMMGMGWFVLKTRDQTILWHAGGTGGYSSIAAFDRAAKRAVILLSDTALTDIGVLPQLSRHLLDPSEPAGMPRTVAVPSPRLLDGLVGRYRLSFGLGADLRRKGDVLFIQADGQPEFELGYDSAGDFYTLRFDATLRPKTNGDGSWTFTWLQAGGIFQAERVR
jgi:serine-type D-Ala-D-Ala carboxypeptidase/endopeptidase